MVMLFVGMQFLDTTNGWLRYSRQASFPFFWIHHPVTFFTAYYTLQWDSALTIKMLSIGVGSFVISLGFYELLIRRINPLRAFFGLRPKQAITPTVVPDS
jgi:hypothetical protein